jgi:hypothetical protein
LRRLEGLSELSCPSAQTFAAVAGRRSAFIQYKRSPGRWARGSGRLMRDRSPVSGDRLGSRGMASSARQPSAEELERIGDRAVCYRRERDQLGARPEPESVPWGTAGGWLSPDGRLWPCPDLCHNEEAERIVNILGLVPGRFGAEYHLERTGWMHVYDDGRVMGVDEDEPPAFTQAQLDRLFDLVRSHPLMAPNVMTVLRQHAT